MSTRNWFRSTIMINKKNQTPPGYIVFCVVFHNMMLSCKMWLVPCATEQQETNNAARNWHGQRTITSPIWCYCWLLLYSAILRSRANLLRSHVILHEWLAFYSAFLNIHWSGVLTTLIRLVPHETAAVSACSVHTIQPSHFTQSNVRNVHVCLAVTCHLCFWQNDWDLLRDIVVTRGGGMDTEIRVSTESWHWRWKLFRRSCRDSNPGPFNHESDTQTTELSPHWLSPTLAARCQSWYVLTTWLDNPTSERQTEQESTT